MSPSATRPDVLLDTVAHLSSPLRDTSSLTPLVHLLTLAYQVKRPPPSKQERLVTLLNTISPPSSLPENADTQVRLGSFIRFLSPVLNGLAGMEDFEAAVGAFSKPGEFREFWDLEGKNLITELISDGASQRMSTGSSVSFLDAFVKDARLRVALTEKQGMLVLVPAETEVGDSLWDTGGMSGAMVKREVNEDSRDIGAAYINGYAS
jgi:hypothetical protein